MSISEAEKSYRRRLLFSAMPDGVTPATMQKSIAILESEFGSVPTLKYSELVARLQENLDRAELNVGALLGKLMVLKKKSPDELRPDPGASATLVESGGGTSNATGSVPSQLEGRLKVFNTLFATITRDLERRGMLAELHSHFRRKVDSLGVSGQCVGSLTKWASSVGAAPSISGTNEDLHVVLNEAFVVLCNKLGPVDADKVLLQAVRVTEAIPEAFDCSPKSFL